LKIGFSLWVVGLAALVLFGAGVWSYWKTKPSVVGLLLVPPILGAAVTVAIGHHLWPRFFFFAFGFAALVVIRGTMIFGDALARILRIPEEKSSWLGTLACIGLIAVSLVSVPLAFGPKQDYIGAMKYIDANLKPGDSIATVSLTTFPYNEYLKKDWNSVNSLSELNDLRAAAQRTWLVYTFPPVLESVHPDITNSIRQDFTLQGSFPGSVGEGTIVVVRSDHPPLDANASGVIP
jgi:hypothetical protein